MGIYQGTLAFTRYRVVGELAKASHASLSKHLAGYRAPKLRITDALPSKPESIGWIRPLIATDEDAVSEDSHWDMADCAVDGGYLLRIRYERRKVPTMILQTLFRSKIREHLQKTGKAMPRQERQELKQQLMTDLTKRTLPVIQFTDVLWREDDSELYVFATSKSARQRAEQLFHQTFGDPLNLSLLRLDGTLAFLDDEDSDEAALTKRLSKLSKIEPAVFAKSQ